MRTQRKRNRRTMLDIVLETVLEITNVHHPSYCPDFASHWRRSRLAAQSRLGLRSFGVARLGAGGSPGYGAHEPRPNLRALGMPRPGDLPEPTKPPLPDPDPDDLPIKDPPVPGVPDVPIQDPPRPPEPPA